MNDLLRALPNPRAGFRTSLSQEPTSPPCEGGLFSWMGGNPQHPNWTAAADAILRESDEESIAVCWSGTLANELFAGDIRNWTKTGTLALDAWLDQTLPSLCDSARGKTLAVVPHHTHLLSDVAGQMRLWHDRSDQGLATVLYPSGLIAPSMLNDIDDHLTRSITNLAPRCCLCILEDLAPPVGAQDDGHFQRAPWGTGMLPHALIERLLNEHLPATTPLMILIDPPFFS